MAALCFGLEMSAQIAQQSVFFSGKGLCYEDEEGTYHKMTQDQIRGLIPYGFDYERYKVLYKKSRICSAFFWGGQGVMVAGFFARTKDDYLGRMVYVAGSIATAMGLIIGDRINGKIDGLVEAMQDSPHLGFTPSGFGLYYTF